MPTISASVSFFRPGLILGLGILLPLGTLPRLKAGDDLPEKEVVAQQDADDFEDINESLYGQKPRETAIPIIRVRLEEILRVRLNAARTRWQLSDSQFNKLELVGNTSIEKLIEEIEQHEGRLKSARQPIGDLYADNPLNRETSAIRSKIRSGPFEGDSMFAKVLRQMLTAEQIAENERRRETATGPTKISRRNATHLARTGRLKFDDVVMELVWNRAGSQLAVVSLRKKIDIYSFPEPRLLRTLAENGSPQGFQFGTNDHLVAIARHEVGVVIANLKTKEEVRLDSRKNCRFLEFSPDGKLLATESYGDAVVKLWSVPTGELIRETLIEGGENGLTLAFSPDGTHLAVGGICSTTRIFETTTGRVLQVLPKVTASKLRFSPTGEILAIVDFDGHLTLWDTKQEMIQKQQQAFGYALQSVDWSPDGTLLATAGTHAPVTLWDADDLSIVNELESQDWVLDMKFTPDGTRLVFAGYPRVQTADKFLDIWAVPDVD